MKRLIFILLGILLLLGLAVLPAAAEEATGPEPSVQTQKEAPPLSPYEWPNWQAYEAAGFTHAEYDSEVYKWERSLMGTYFRWTRYDAWGAKAKFDPAFRPFYADDPLLVIDNHIVYLKGDLTDRRGRPTGKIGLSVLDYFDTDEAQAATTKVTVPAFVGDLPVVGIYGGRTDGEMMPWSAYSNDTIRTIVVKAPLTAVDHHSFANLTALEKLVLPDTVESFGFGAFSGCRSLRRLICGGAIKKICDDAFLNCEQLDYRVPSTVEWIGWDAFRNSGIKKVVLPLSVRLDSTEEGETADHVFADCKQLTSVRFTGGENTVWYQTAYGMFSGCTALKTVVLPTEFKKMILSSGTFRDCRSLQTIRNLSSVSSIEETVFQDCTGLRKLTIPKEIEFIHETAFKGCKGLRALTLETKDTTFFHDRDDWVEWSGDEGFGGELVHSYRSFLQDVPKKCTVYVSTKDMKYAVRAAGFKGAVKIRVNVPTPKTARMTRQNGKVRFVWSTVTKADGYRIWSYDAKTGKYTRLATVKAPKTTVTLKSNAKQFVIRAWRVEAGDISWSAIKAFK